MPPYCYTKITSDQQSPHALHSINGHEKSNDFITHDSDCEMLRFPATLLKYLPMSYSIIQVDYLPVSVVSTVPIRNRRMRGASRIRDH